MTKRQANSAIGTYLPALTPYGIHAEEAVGAAEFVPVRDGREMYILVQARDEDINFTLSEGSAPTGAVGFILIAGDAPTLIALSRVITLTFFGTDAGSILEYQFFT